MTTSPGVIGAPGAGDWLVMVPCGWVLLASGTCCSWYPPDCAWPWASWNCWPTKSGSGGPALTAIPTGLVCGQEVPATGVVLTTMPAPMVADAVSVTAPGVRPAFLSAASAAAWLRPVTCGTLIMTGPVDTMMVTTAPRLALEPMAGSVAMTSPFAMTLSCLAGPSFTAKPRFCSSVRAVLAAIARTWGTVTYCPSVTHQAIRPTITTTARARAR